MKITLPGADGTSEVIYNDRSWVLEFSPQADFLRNSMRILGLSTIDYILPAPKFLFNAAPQNFTSFDNTSNLRFNFNPNLSFRFQKSMQRAANSSNSLRSTRVQCSADGETDDGFYIRRCVELARKGMGFTSPNPMVGCIIVKDGKIVGQGFHPKAGQPHAEVFALRDAGDLAENATAYVSLEPCNHYGRTPPCTEALIKARVKKVVVGMVDPNPIVASKGIERLRNAGIEVVVGVEEELCKRLIEAFSHRMLTGRPLLTIRYSLSVDGHFVDQLGEGVTDSGGYYSQLLQEYDAVVLSSSLFGESISVPSTQESGANQPLRLIVQRNPSSSVQVPLVVNEATDKTIIFTDKNNAATPEMSQKGIETVAMDWINLDTILDYCHHQGLCSVLLDLRGNLSDFEELIKEGIEKKYFNKLVAEILPVWNGYGKGHTLMALHSLEKGPKLTNLQSKTLDQSVVIEGYFNF